MSPPRAPLLRSRASQEQRVAVGGEQVCLAVAAAVRAIDVWITDHVLQFYDGEQPLRTAAWGVSLVRNGRP